MDEATNDGEQEKKEDGDKKRNILEEMSKEELIKRVKKYLNLLQKSKNKTDELSKKCISLEEEKKTAIEAHQSSEKELLNRIDDLQLNITKLKEEKLNFQNYEEVEELKHQLQELVNERKKYASTLRENEDQMQCLKLQLQSLKDGCQCIQEENQKLQKSNKEMLDKMNSLIAENDALSSYIKKKTEDYDALLNVKGDLEEKYKDCVDKIHSLSSNSKELQAENDALKENKDMDLIKLVQDNQEYKKRNEDLEKENEDLKKEIESKTESFKSQPLDGSETDTSSLKKSTEYDSADILKLKESATALEKENALVKEQVEALRLQLDERNKQIGVLEEEVKKFSSIYEMNDYKMGIEFALLQGAEVEGLIYPTTQQKASVEEPQPKTSESIQESFKMAGSEDLYSTGSGAEGLEYALLQGGDASNLIMPNAASSNYVSPSESELASSTFVLTNEIYRYKTLLDEKCVEIERLKKNLQDYSSLYSETLEENEHLRKKLCEFNNKENHTNKILMHKDTYTDFDGVEYSEHTDVKSSETKECEAEDLQDDVSVEKYKALCKDIVLMYEKFKSQRNLPSTQDISRNDPQTALQFMFNLYISAVNDFEKKNSELDDYNLQLELLIIGIKQGVRQKTTVMSYKTENSFEENMNQLKVLLDDLNMCYSSKLKNLEVSFLSDKKKIEEELIELKELKKFLEDENRELNNELEKFKSNLVEDENYNNARIFGDVYQQSPELYSIEESNEIDDRSDTNANLIESDQLDALPKASDISVQTLRCVKDFAVQIDLDLFYGEEVLKNIDAFVQTDLEDEDREIIEKLKQENESLKTLLSEKTNLVENIHCQMDSLLTKVEELSVELQNKEDDLKHSKNRIVDLQTMLAEMQNLKNQQKEALSLCQNLIQEFRMKYFDLNNDIKGLHVDFTHIMNNINCDIMNIISQKCENLYSFEELCYHKENNLNVIKEWIVRFIKDFECWINAMEHSVEFYDENSTPLDIASLERFSEISVDKFSFTEATCESGACCDILENIRSLNDLKSNLFSSFYNHLINNHSSLIKSLQNYKINIIPNLEKNLAEYEQKIANCTCQNKEEKVCTEEAVQKSADESLKNTLAETEIKMNKLKQIAMKLKKELAQTKEQYNDVALEKENLKKKNAELLEEINQISKDQFTYGQNYQSLQNEFDKLQDDYEMYKQNAKKLEEDLATKIHELSSSKEHVIELESQLKSSKLLHESNLSIKKELEMKCADLESKVIVLESKINEKEQKINSMAADISKHLKDISAVQEEKNSLKNQLELAQKEGNKKSLLDLEMADYERSITELNNKIQRKDDELEELQKEISSLKERYDCLQDELKSTESLKETEAKRAESLKQILEKTKSELKEVKDREADLLSKTASLEVQLETMTQQEEDFKLRLSENLSQIQHFQDVIKASSENHQRIVRSFEQKVSNQKEEILLAHKEVESVKQEFENYKIRVHSVLKQQKTVTPAIATIDPDVKEKLETLNEKLKLQIKDLSEKQTALSLEYKALQEDHDSLLHRYNKVVEEKEQKDKEWHQRLELLNAEKSRLRANQEELSSQHLLQNEMLVATYKKQIKIMSEEHKRIVSDLQKQLDAADVEIARLQRDQQKLQGLPIAPLPQDNAASFDILSQERQECEGSESTDETTTPIRQLSLATIPTSGFLPFEKLLQSPLEPGTPASYISNNDSEKLTAELNTANKRIDHLSELLNDSESTNLRLSEQVRVLKDEVRRLENNTERQQHAENLEYLKNVVIKFASLQPGSEKAMLIPVLTTMLKLSPNEQQQLKSVAGDLESGDTANSGWGSYLHRWSGLS